MVGLSAISDVPAVGRNMPYLIPLAIFVLLQIPTGTAVHLSAMLVLRFLAGFCGGPPLATGGASMGDIWSPSQISIAIGVWGCGAVLGPSVGPLVGGFAVQSLGWRWWVWPLMILSGTVLVFLFFTLPETLADNVLLRRARRLRRLTGNPHLRARCELRAKKTFKEEIYEVLYLPLYLAVTQPIVIALSE